MSYDKDDISTPDSGDNYEDFLAEVTDGGDNLNDESLLKEEDSPIDELKALVLSIDWEITDQSMHAFGKEINKLKEKLGDDKVLLNFLKILGALGEYIRAAKDLSHPDSIKILHSVYNNLEEVVKTPGISEKEKKRIILVEFAKYNALKDELREIKASTVNEMVGDGSREASSADTSYRQERETAFSESEAVHDDEDDETYDEIELTPGVDGIIDDLSRESSIEHESTIHDTEIAHLKSTAVDADVEEEVGEDGDIYTEIELVPGVDGIIDDLSRETSNVPDLPDAKDATDREMDEDQVIAPVLASYGGDGVGEENEFSAERGDDVSFAAVDQILDDFFVEDEAVASAPIEEGMALDDSVADDVVILAVDDAVEGGTELELQAAEDELVAPIDEGVSLLDSDADNVVLLAVDQEGAEDGGADAIIDLQSTDDDSVADFDQPLDDFFGKDEVVASAPIEEGIALDDAEADDVMLLAVEEETVEDGQDPTEIKQQSPEDDSLTAFDQSLDDFFGADEAVASAPIEEGEILDNAEADDVMLLAVEEEVAEDGQDLTEMEQQSAEDDSLTSFDQGLDDFFDKDKAVASAPIEEGIALDDADADDVVLLAVEEELAEDDGGPAAIELQSSDDESATDFDQRLDDFFDDDNEVPVSASLEESMSLDGAEADVLVMMTGDDEVDDDAETDKVIELHHAVEDPSSKADQHFEESFSYGKGVSEEEKLKPHTEHAVPVEPLKSVILALNRQLSEEGLADFSVELIRLKAHWESEKVLLIFLHLIESLGDHLKEMGAHMHPNTTQLLLSIYGKLEKAASAKSNDVIRHGILLEAIKLYIKWNEKNIGAVLLPEQRIDESSQNMILLGSAEEMNILEPID